MITADNLSIDNGGGADDDEDNIGTMTNVDDRHDVRQRRNERRLNDEHSDKVRVTLLLVRRHVLYVVDLLIRCTYDVSAEW